MRLIRHDFGTIHDALNNMIVAETKAALMQLPDKEFEKTDGCAPLCRIVVSNGFDYNPIDLNVKRVWLNGNGELCFSEYLAEEDEDDVYAFTENDDLLDITDFGYLIDQIAENSPEDKRVNLANESLLVAGYVTEQALKQEVDKTF